jgi:dTDP-4-dehydrorhamnose reductase
MRHIILGASGLIGKELYLKFKSINKDVVGTYYKHHIIDELVYFDITEDSLIDKFNIDQDDICYLFSSEINPNWVYNNPDISNKINIDSTKRLLDEIKSKNATVVFISTEIVFDGKIGGYKEDDKTNPTTLYAKQKIIIEEYIKTENIKHLIIRTGATVPNNETENCPITKTYESLKSGNAKMIKDNIMTITHIDDTINSLLILIDNKFINDTYHIVANPPISREEMAQLIVKHSKNSLIKSFSLCTLEEINYPEPRPLKSWLSNEKLISSIDYSFKSPNSIILQKIELLDKV